MTIYEQIQEKARINGVMQDAINAGAPIRQDIIDTADMQNEQWPQYRGHWDGPEWVMVRITADIKTKLGVAFKAGDVTIAKRSPIIGDWTAYSIRNGIDTGICWGIQRI